MPTRRASPPRTPRAGAAAISVLVDERFGGTWDDLRAARAATDAPLLAKGFFSTDDDLRTAKEAGADAALLLLRDLDDERGRELHGRCGRLSGSTRSSRRTTPAELDRGIALGAPVLGVNARDLSTFAIDREAQLELLARIPARPARDRRVRHPHARAGRRRRARRRRRDPRRLGADARARPGGEARGAPLAPARQGVRPDARGGRRGRGRGRRRPPRLRARAGEPARGRRACCRCPTTTLSVAVWVGEAGDSDADLDQVHTVEEGKVRGRDATLLRGGVGRSRALLDLPWEEDGSGALASSAARAEGRIVLAGGLGPENVAEAIAAVRPWAVDASLVARVVARDQGSRQGEGLRGGGARMTDRPEETYGPYGGRYVPETLIPALDELTAAWEAAKADPAFAAELDELGRTYVGRPSPITLAERFAPDKRLYLKREDLNHTGAHKINNALGQVVLARRLGKTRIIAETGAGQHGVATATACARFGLECVVYMGVRGHAPAGAQRRADAPARRDASSRSSSARAR